MDYLTFHDAPDVKIAIMSTQLDHDGMLRNYVLDGIQAAGLPDADKHTVAIRLPMVFSNRKVKAPSVAEQREFLSEAFELMVHEGITHVIISEAKYFKTASGAAKAPQEVGNLFSPEQTYFSEYADKLKIGYMPNYKMVFYDPVKTRKGIQITTEAVVRDLHGAFQRPGDGIIKSAHYPMGDEEIKNALKWLIDKGCPYSCDIETFSLDMHDAGIASISFAIDQHHGISFLVDPAPGIYNYEVRAMLYEFFMEHTKKNLWHNAAFDITVLLFQLTRHQGPDFDYDTEYLFDAMTDPELMNCTKIISYLATNSCAGNKLSLKDQAVEFAGNYAVDDIKDVTKIPVKELLEYNLVDALSTWFVYEKNEPKMVADHQDDIYHQIFLPSLVDVIDMQLNGLPVDPEQVQIAKRELQQFQDAARSVMLSSPYVTAYTHKLKQDHVDKMHAQWKKKRITVADVDLEFNPGSTQQLQGLLFDSQYMGLPVVAQTPSGAASTKGKDLKAMKSHTKDPDILAFLDALIDYKDSAILLSTFIPALENARLAPDGNYYMHGNFNLGGTVSGRLSSSDPNLQNIPSKSRLAKYIKKCIKAPAGWIFVGLDFDSLEDKISALLTKDPNKIKVYTDGYDGHSLRAYSYFGHMMPDIDPNCVQSINSIATKYADYRQSSKAPTFLLTYGGTYHGLISNCGFPEPVALSIESNYHELYKVSDEWVADKIDGASKNGYITAAFGLRVRTPILNQVVLGNRKTPNAAKQEARTAGNALGQSWGLLNNRACSEFMGAVRANAEMRRNIRVCCQIHDAQYYLIKDDLKTLKWFNDRIVQAVTWQNHPDITHPDVKLSGQTSIFYPTWAEEHVIPNYATEDDISKICAGIGAQYRP